MAVPMTLCRNFFGSSVLYCGIFAGMLMSAPVMHAESPSSAAQPLLPGVGTADSRRSIDPNALPWSAIGRVQTELGGRCTGFLVAPTVVETAAHCLYLPKTGHYIQPRDVHFVRAYTRGQFDAHARAVRFLVPPQYDPTREASTAAYDRATLFLEAAVSNPDQVLHTVTALPPVGMAVVLGGYEQDHREILVSDTDCRVTAIAADGAGHPMIEHDCSATRGSSGAPLLALQDGHWMALGVQALANPGRGGAAVPLNP